MDLGLIVTFNKYMNLIMMLGKFLIFKQEFSYLVANLKVRGKRAFFAI